MKNKFKIKKNSEFGYMHLYPLPSQKFLDDFYKNEYYKILQKRGGTKESKLINKNNKAEELNWLQQTCFKDRLEVLNGFFALKNRTIVDVGCGSGEFLKFMKKNGWKVFGIEPSNEAFKKAQKNGIEVLNVTFEQFLKEKKFKNKLHVIVLTNVLEHILTPQETLLAAKRLLQPGGIIFIDVPNDFNVLQLAAQKKVKKEWWMVFPDHINYFNFQSLEKLLKKCGFSVLIKTTHFPMELFLLMGEDYVNNANVGRYCHQKRVNFELAIPKILRRDLYKKLAELGIGRECIIYAKKI